MVGEKAELPGRAIPQSKRVLGGRRKEVVVAGVDTNAVRDRFREPGLGFTVACDVQHFEFDGDAIAETILVARREIAIDAASNLVAFRAYGDVLGDDQAPACFDRDVYVITQDPLFGLDKRGREQCEQSEEQAGHGVSSTRNAGRSSSRA